MENKALYTIIIIVVILAIIGGIWWLWQSQQANTSSYTGNTNTQSNQATGKVIFSITDAALSMKNISSVKMTVSNVQMHSDTQGWVTVSGAKKEFDLLQLKASGKLMLEGSADVPSGLYNQIRMQIDKVVVTQSGSAKEAQLPSGQLTLNANVKVNDNSTSSVVVDFLADKSLHVTSKGEFIFTPTVKMEARSGADAQVASDGSVVINGGNVDANVSAGMDLTGAMKPDYILDTNSNLEINNGVIQLKGNTTTNTTGTGANANTGVNVGGY